MWEKIYDLKFGETTISSTNGGRVVEKITRVPAGWIYVYGDMQGCATTFIPYSSEFKQNK